MKAKLYFAAKFNFWRSATQFHWHLWIVRIESPTKV